MRDLDFGGVEAVGVHAEAVILGCNFHFPGLYINDRMICAAMTEFQFVGLSAEGKAQNLMTKALQDSSIFGSD